MDTSTIVNIILCILSFILAAVSVITVVITLKQNSKMIENSTRPYIVVYSATTNVQSPNYYLCVKNFGQSGAIVTSFSCDHDLKDYSYDSHYVPFKHLPNTFIAPNQSFISNVDVEKLFEDPHPLTFTIGYSSGNKHYSDKFEINIEADSDLIQTRANTPGQEYRTISYSLQNILEKML